MGPVGTETRSIAGVRAAAGISYPDGAVAWIRMLADDHGVPW
jgi:hypothetical protein